MIQYVGNYETMMRKSLMVLLGNQLFSIEEIKKTKVDMIFMSEDYDLCTYEKHHKLKILMFLVAMREKRDELIASKFELDYRYLEETPFPQSYEEKLKACISDNDITEVQMFEIEDKVFEKRIIAFFNNRNVSLTFINSPMFLIKREDFSKLSGNSSSPRMAQFYKNVRKKLNILIDNGEKPVGGKWSFDNENRKKIPKTLSLPKLFKVKEQSEHIVPVKNLISRNFPEHPGCTDTVWMPLTREAAIDNLDYFLEVKFKEFGTYEDAILKEDTFLFHSGISSSLNIGLIPPADVINKALKYANKENTPINSLEGFIRQIIGWREFIRGIYQNHSDKQISGNYFNFSRKLKSSWYNNCTGIEPLDDAINFSNTFGYTHHINRLMVIANIMTLCEVDPKAIYKWFMEMYVDSSEWVMVPNVFGMGTFADGGIFSTKPYICGSNYILKMSNYKKGDWCNIVDGLYWLFIERNMTKLKDNPRLPFAKKTLANMDTSRKELIFNCARQFISTNCY